MEQNFSKHDTLLVKGLAAVFLVLHHVIGVNPGLSYPLFSEGTGFYEIIGGSTKVCVSIFLVLSGYGMMEKGLSLGRFTYRDVFLRLKKLYGVYWITYTMIAVWMVLNSGFSSFLSVYGFQNNFLHALLCLVKDLLGFYDIGYDFHFQTPTLNGGTWFLGTIVLCYLLFPVLLFVYRKGKLPAQMAVLVIAYLPWIFYLRTGDLSMHTDRELFYFFPFCLGMFLSSQGLLNRLKQLSLQKRILSPLLCLICLFLALAVRQSYCMPADPLLALAVVAFMISTVCVMNPCRLLPRFLIAVGSFEAYIYYLHPIGLSVGSVMSFHSFEGRVITTALICFMVSYSCSVVGSHVQHLLSGKKTHK